MKIVSTTVTFILDSSDFNRLNDTLVDTLFDLNGEGWEVKDIDDWDSSCYIEVAFEGAPLTDHILDVKDILLRTIMGAN